MEKLILGFWYRNKDKIKEHKFTLKDILLLLKYVLCKRRKIYMKIVMIEKNEYYVSFCYKENKNI